MGIGLLSAVVFTPLIGALVIGFAPVRWARVLALATALIAWVISLWVAIGFDPEAGGFQLVEELSPGI